MKSAINTLYFLSRNKKTKLFLWLLLCIYFLMLSFYRFFIVWQNRVYGDEYQRAQIVAETVKKNVLPESNVNIVCAYGPKQEQIHSSLLKKYLLFFVFSLGKTKEWCIYIFNNEKKYNVLEIKGNIENTLSKCDKEIFNYQSVQEYHFYLFDCPEPLKIDPYILNLRGRYYGDFKCDISQPTSKADAI